METMLQFNKKHLKGLNEIIYFLDRCGENLDPVKFTSDGEQSDLTVLRKRKAISDAQLLCLRDRGDVVSPKVFSLNL